MTLFSSLRSKIKYCKNENSFSDAPSCQKSSFKNTMNEGGSFEKLSGLGIYVASLMLFTSCSGTGFLIFPKAVANAGWFISPILITLLSVTIFTSTKLATCRLILQERWPEYSQSIRKPYMEVGYRAYGKIGRTFVSTMILFTTFGSAIVNIIMISQLLHSLYPLVPFCYMIIIVTVALSPFSWLGSPKDFWQVTFLSTIGTALGCIMISADLISKKNHYSPSMERVTSSDSVILAVGTTMYLTGIGSGVLSIQNDMKDKTQCVKSVSIAFIGLLILCVPFAVIAYIVLGSNTPENILLYAQNEESLTVKVATYFTIANLVSSFLMCFSQPSLFAEESFNIPDRFCMKRIILRTFILTVMLLVALGFPELGLIINLMGGITVSFNSYIFPSLFYLKLVKDSTQNKDWPQRTVTVWENVLLWASIILGAVICVSVTTVAIKGILGVQFTESCFTKLCTNESFFYSEAVMR